MDDSLYDNFDFEWDIEFELIFYEENEEEQIYNIAINLLSESEFEHKEINI
jgi:hypothetical protein